MKNYLKLVNKVLTEGEFRADRTGTGTYAIFGEQLRFNMADGFPAVTTKKLAIQSVWVELLWMLRGETSGKFMKENGCRIWNEWMDENDDLGRVYGVQWRRWKGKVRYLDEHDDFPTQQYIDQLQNAIDTIRKNPTDRRLLVSAWNPGELDEMALPPCHYSYQFFVHNDGRLDILVNQRSADVFLGLPFDIASYATLLHMVAYVTNKVPGELIYNLGDTHIYTNHVEQMKIQLEREPKTLPTLLVNTMRREINEIDDFKLTDLELLGYKHDAPLKGKVSV